MLTVVPKAWSYTFSVADGANAVAEVVDLTSWLGGDKGELRVGGETFSARREKSTYILESTAGVVAQARHRRPLSSDLVIEHAGCSYSLRAKSTFSGEFLLFDGETQVGLIAPEGLFKPEAKVDLPREFPLFLQVFVIWLAMTLWKHGAST